MSIATVVTRGYGTFGSIPQVVTRGYFVAIAPPAPKPGRKYKPSHPPRYKPSSG